MGYPDELLARDEKVVRHLHPHWITLVYPIFILVIVLAVGGFLVAILPDGGAHDPLLIAIGVVGLVLLVWLTLVPFLRWKTTHYVLTTHRLMTRIGILNHRGRDVPLNRINNALYEQSIWDRIINSGTLMVESAGEDGQQVFKNIPNADQTQQLINRLVEEDHDRRTRESARYEAEYEAEYDRRGPTSTRPIPRYEDQ